MLAFTLESKSQALKDSAKLSNSSNVDIKNKTKVELQNKKEEPKPALSEKKENSSGSSKTPLPSIIEKKEENN